MGSLSQQRLGFCPWLDGNLKSKFKLTLRTIKKVEFFSRCRWWTRCLQTKRNRCKNLRFWCRGVSPAPGNSIIGEARLPSYKDVSLEVRWLKSKGTNRSRILAIDTLFQKAWTSCYPRPQPGTNSPPHSSLCIFKGHHFVHLCQSDGTKTNWAIVSICILWLVE